MPTIAQALHVINGDTLNKKLSAPEGTIALFLKLGLSDRRILEYMYPVGVQPLPHGPGAADAGRRARKGAPDDRHRGGAPRAHRQALEDMVWAMLTSKEFLFNH